MLIELFGALDGKRRRDVEIMALAAAELFDRELERKEGGNPWD